MKLFLTDAEVHTSITKFYDSIARRLGLDVDKCRYDCLKIEVAQNIFDRIYDYYSETEHIGMDTMGMRWCCFGPKVNKEFLNYQVDIQEGFITEEEK